MKRYKCFVLTQGRGEYMEKLGVFPTMDKAKWAKAAYVPQWCYDIWPYGGLSKAQLEDHLEDTLTDEEAQAWEEQR